MSGVKAAGRRGLSALVCLSFACALSCQKREPRVEQAIPRYVYEAAEIDRARRWLVFRAITLPMPAPLLGLAVLLRATDALEQFDLIMAITGPNDATTQTLAARIYQVVFRDCKVGLGSAYGVVILVAVIAVAALFVRYIDGLQRRRGKTEARD